MSVDQILFDQKILNPSNKKILNLNHNQLKIQLILFEFVDKTSINLKLK
jgi:hypothetical protein